jgi:hypothetical protein
MSRITLPILALALVSCIPASAQNTVNFSGTWKSDSARSESAHQAVPAGAITLVIAQTDAAITIETKTAPKDRSSIVNEKLTYKLDGTESEMTGSAGTPITCRAHWDGPQLIIETIRNLNESTVSTRWTVNMSENGKEMTIRKTLTVQHGYQAQGAANNVGAETDVFVKVGTGTNQKKS